MSSLPITPPKARVDPAPSRSASPPGGSSGEDFAALLSQTTNQARTAPAEGRNTRPAQSRRDDDGRAQRSQHDDDATTDATSRASDDASTTQSQPTAKDATDPDAKGNGGQQPTGQDAADSQQPQSQGNPDANAAASTAAAIALAAQATPVVAKGAGFLAARIRQVAVQNGVPILERKPLAQALYKTVDVGQEVPPDLYQAIAEILAYVYELAGKGARQQMRKAG